MNQKSTYAPRVVVASRQGGVIHIKSKQSGQVILKLKLLPGQYPGEQELLIDHCDTQTGYDMSTATRHKIAAYERGEVPA